MVRIKSESELLNQDLRKKIIDEIKGNEEQARRTEAYRRHLAFKDQTDLFVKDLLLRMFQQSTVEKMQYSMANISLVRKVINKLARVYDHGCQRSIEPKEDVKPKPDSIVLEAEVEEPLDEVEDVENPDDEAAVEKPVEVVKEVDPNEEENEKLHKLEKELDINSKMKMVNQYLKLNRNVSLYLKPCPIIDVDGTIVGYEIDPCVLPSYLYSVVENYYKRTEPMAYILSNYKKGEVIQAVENPAAAGRTIPAQPNIRKGDGQDQALADTPEDANADGEEYIWWTNHYHFTTNSKGELIGVESVEEIANPIEELPIVNFAIGQEGQFWAEGGKDLVDGGVLVNALQTNINHIGVSQGYGQLVMKGKNLPTNITTGPDFCIKLEYAIEDGTTPVPEVDYITANPNLDALRSLVEAQVAMLLTTNNLSTSGVATQLNSSSSPASGIALIIDKSESQEDVNDQQQLFIDKEPLVWRVINKWLMYFAEQGTLSEDLDGLQLPEGFDEDFVIMFNHPQTILSEKEKLENIEKRKDLGLNTMEELMIMDQPMLTEEQAKMKLEKVRMQKQENMAAFAPQLAPVEDEDVDNGEEDKQQQLNFE